MFTQRKIHSGFVGAMFLAALLLLFLFHTKPTQKQVSALADGIGALKNSIAEISDKQVETEKGGDLSEIEQKELFQAIPENLDQDILIIDINKLAKAADVSFNALNFTMQTNASIPTVRIAAGFQGPSANIIRFLKMVEVNPRKLVVKDSSVAHAETEGGLDLINLNVTLEAFYRKAQ